MPSEHLNQPNSIEESASELYAKMREIGPDIAELEAEHELFAGAVDRLVSLHPNPDQRATVMIAGGIFEWFYFGGSDDPMPTGLLKVIDDDTKTIHVEIDRRIIAANDLRRAWYSLKDTLGGFNGQIPNSRDSDLNQLDPALQKIVEQTEGHRIVRSFSIAPPESPAPHPLPPWLRAVRESQIDTEVRQRYGIADGDHIPKRSPADFARRRALFHLDDETIPHKHQESPLANEPLDKMRHYFAPIILDLLRKGVDPADKHRVTDFRLDADDDYVAYAGDEDLGSYIENYNYLKSHYATLRAPDGYEVDAPFEASYLENVCNRVFWEVSSEDSYEEIIEDALRETVGYSHDVLRGNPFIEYSIYEDALTLHALIRQTKGGAIYRSQLEKYPFAKECLKVPGLEFASEQELRKLEARPIGRIHRRDKTSIKRLIQTATSTPNLPASDPRAELVFDFWEKIPADEEPFVPGFVAVSYDPRHKRWGFMPDPEGDPYAEAAIPMPPDAVQELATQYEAIGLQNLAKKLHRKPNLTVAELVECIQSHTRYILPRKSSNCSSLQLIDFHRFAKEGELRLQCSGSAIFLKRSLEAVFGKSCAAVQEGHVLPSGNDVINSVGHAQVAFTHDSHTFMLDATGRGRAGGVRGIVGNFLGRGSRKHNHQTPYVAPKPAPPGPPAVQSAEDFTPQQLESNKFIFEQQLMNIFGFTDAQQLYEHLAPLSSDDPLRRTMSIMLDADAPAEALQDTLDYIEAILSADDETLQSVGLLHYKGNEVLDVTKSALKKALTLRQ